MTTKPRGPVFPSFSGTTGYHMLCETTAPACTGLDGKFHRIAIPLDLKNGAQHNPTVWLAPDGLRVIIRVLHGMKTTNYAARVNDAWLLEEATVVRQAPYDAQIEDLRVFNRPDGLWAIAAVHDGRQQKRQRSLRVGGRLVVGGSARAPDAHSHEPRRSCAAYRSPVIVLRSLVRSRAKQHKYSHEARQRRPTGPEEEWV